MKFYGIDCVGNFQIQTVTSLPTFNTTTDVRRLIYNSDDNRVYYGKEDRWTVLGSGSGQPDSSFVTGDTCYPGMIYLIDTSSSVFTGTLSTNVVDGDIVSVLDVGSNFGTNSFTMNSGSGNTIKSGTSYTCNDDDGFYQFIYHESTNDWKVVASNTIDIATYNLSDVSSATPSDNDILKFNSATGKYEPNAVSGGITDDSVYGLIRYQPSAPVGPSDETVYVDSDNDTLYIYDSSTSTWKSISGGTGSSSVSADSFPLLKAENFSLDDTDIDVSRGTAFSMIETIDFGEDADGAAWCSFHFSDNMDSDSDINMTAVYVLNGSDDSKNISLDVSYWCYGNNVTPNPASPDATNNTSIGSDTTQGVRRSTALSAISSSDITNNDTITIKVKRNGSSDTYTGTFQLLYIYLYQA
jgi:hypothetical protein